jgi:hypothetical protein
MVQAFSTTTKWPSLVVDDTKSQNIVNLPMSIWNEFDSSRTKPPKEANIYVSPYHYLKWLHHTQKDMSKIQYIQENAPSKTSFPGFVYRTLKEINHVLSLNNRAFRSLKEAVLNAIKPKEPLKISSKI